MAGWYVIVDGVEHGPLSVDKVKAAVQKGKITADTLMRKDGMDQAVPASSIKGLIPGTASQSPQPRTGTQTRRRGRVETGTQRKKRPVEADQPIAPAAPEAEPVFDAFAKDADYIRHIDKHHISDNYYYEGAKAFLYPCSINSIAFLLGYVVVVLIHVYAGIFLTKAWVGFEYIFFFMMCWFVMYALAYLQRIGQRSAQGDMKAPVWPELGAMLEEILGPAAVILGGWVIFRLPYMLVAWTEPSYIPASEGLNDILSGVDTYISHALNLLLRLPETGLEYIMQAISFLIFPIGMVFIMVKGGFLGLKPAPLFRTLFSMLPEYAYCAFLVLVCHIVMMIGLHYTAAHFLLNEAPSFATMSFSFFPRLGFVEVLSFTALAIIPTGYLLMVQFRLMGLLYQTQSDKFE
jgi:hypothetical protein